MADQHTHMVHLRHHKHLLEATHHKDSNQINDSILPDLQSHNTLLKVDHSLSTLSPLHNKGKRQHKDKGERLQIQTQALTTYTLHHPPELTPTIQDAKPLRLIHEQPLQAVQLEPTLEVLKS